MESGVLTKVINDFFTTVDGELCLSKGDYFMIYKVIDKHWCYGECHEKKGKFPTNYLHKVDVPNLKDSESLFIAIASFNGEQQGDLSFGKGEFIIGVKDVEPGWHFGYIDSRNGVFPLTHVWLLNSTILKKPTDKKCIRKKGKVNTSLKAQLDEELDLIEGEIVTVLEIVDDGWVRGITADGRTGTFPEGFITYIDDNHPDEIDEASEINMNSLPQSVANGEKIFKDFGDSVGYNCDKEEQAAPSYYDLFPDADQSPNNSVINNCVSTNSDNLNPFSVNPYAITLYPFNAQFHNELNFDAGEVVHLIKHIDCEWAEGTINGETGIFPTSYVNIIVDCSNLDIEQIERYNEELSSDEQLHADDFAKVEYTFNAQMNGDLSVTEGDIVTIIEMTNNDWVSVKNNSGDVGLCPRAYLSCGLQLNHEKIRKDDEIDDNVVIRNHEKSPVAIEDERSKRLSEPHRPAPPAPAPGSIPLQKQSVADKTIEQHHAESNERVNEVNEIELAIQKKLDKRQNVISELVITEKEYVRDLKVTYETFNLYNPSILEARGIDVTILFGNILELIHVAEELLDSILRAMKGRDENSQMISPCFLKMSDELQTVYGKYCGNHEDALLLLHKYEENKDIMAVFDKGIETLRHQVVCFDMSSILIKPVQRILKYPLMLYELIKCTEDNHPDKVGIEEAWKAMTAVASHINEYKRRKDIVSKYLDCEDTIMRKMAKLNMHSVAKKSSRLSAKLSATLGLTNIPPDPQFDELERQFKSLEKCTLQLANDVEQCLTYSNDEAICGELLSDYLKQYHGVSVQEIDKYHETRVLISAEYMKVLKDTIEKRVNQPITSLIILLEGPAKLITKRYDKLLDYDNAISKSEKYKDNRSIQEELATAKNNYEALNQQLVEELVVIIDAGTKITATCIHAFANTRKLFYGKIMKRYLTLSESATQVTPEDIHQSFLVNHNLLWNQISRFSFAGANPMVEEAKIDIAPQTERQRATLLSKISHEKLFIARENVISTSSLDLGITKGTIVAVIKRQDPMGDCSRWFIDNGVTKGFVPSNILEPLPQSRMSTLTNNDVVDSRTSTPDLMCLDSPVKEIKTNLISLDSPMKKSPNASTGNSLWYLNLDKLQGETQNYENISSNQKERYENYGEIKFYYAQYNFDGEIAGTLAIKKGQALKLIRPYDEKNNSAWWLMENRDGNKGYVPSNYLNIYR